MFEKTKKVSAIPLLQKHRKYMREKLRNPETHGIPIPNPKIPSLATVTEFWMSFTDVCQILDSVPHKFTKSTEFFRQLKKPEGWAQINGIVFHVNGSLNGHWGDSPLSPHSCFTTGNSWTFSLMYVSKMKYM